MKLFGRRRLNIQEAFLYLGYGRAPNTMRRAFNIFTALSLVLCALAVNIAISFQTIDNELGPPSLSDMGSPAGLPRLTFMWYPAMAFAVLPVTWLPVQVLIQRNGRRRNGRCHVCGYDLRATPDRCPECGTVPLPRSLSRPDFEKALEDVRKAAAAHESAQNSKLGPPARWHK